MTVGLDERYRLDVLDEVDSPALLVFPEVIAQNIDRAVAMTDTPQGNCLRPHIKTVKCREIVDMALARNITRFKCSTVSEGEMLGAAGAAEVLLSYQLSAVKARRWRELCSLYPATEFASLIDNAVTARMLSDLFFAHPQSVYIDVNVGMDRTGIRPAEVMQLLEQVVALSGIRVRGLHVYDGHIRDTETEVREVRTAAVYREVDALRKEAGPLLGDLELVMAGSPTFPYYIGKPNTTVSPGTFYLWDAGYGKQFPELPFEPAALILSRIISIIDEHTICFDLGSKAVAADPPQPRVVFPKIDHYEIRLQSEEHLVLTVPDSRRYRVGQAFYAIPWHVCPTVNLYEELLPVIDGKVEEPWSVVARNRRITV
ncbi:D-serine deaminase-like pyridoxal phosphate-dependent protein [Lewinella aquimaris]|uniref:D-serine deaminase-like pyridoxal phosphate-dependent protein n=1 Tax=Neolewinella aquimaris TaxID=1835722 RepID=A0A840E4K2_9BACT|nr:alanine racemase [Neolewinella aquimaris]MBB4078672.1 D-serine deaminase-like pyridoxal phosphate-dependent protein [Neolewinella aquimaris]